MGCLEEHKRLLCVTLLISEATEICYILCLLQCSLVF